ncbi:LUD domain-containing protein [Desulfotomaculum copahuensis]|uniref:LUD domain-containing protein n=1 Tax=Desulfotomaculum copahuensis TaxID=1838280 RepID=UPI00098FF7FB|nr:LUD domain-containing protein [Desulfotomaculum copahuensis]
MSAKDLRQKSREALANENLGCALGRFSDSYVVSREEIYRGMDFQALREEVAGIKSGAALHMEELAARFQAAAEKRGAKVFRAATAQVAREYIARLAKERGVELIVKSKSMASEEMHLNDYLQEQGLNVAETDLGEWIIQLSCQKPSHMVMPAIHLSKEEVAAIFSKEMGREVEPDIPDMVKLARQELRKKFLAAGMGISGGNIAVAETGTVVMVTNEGNGRLTTSLPPLHVIIVGLEKLVPRFTDVAPILEVLPRSATAQHITSYVTMITGPVPAEGLDGREYPKKELHIVLLDNGRTRMAADPVFREALQCVRCAACLNVCPVYQLVGGLFGDVYTGGIGAVLTAFFTNPEKAGEIQNLCLRCERCRDFCSGNIDLPGLIGELRRRTVQKEGMSAGQRLIFEKVLADRRLFHSLLRLAAKAQKPFARGGRIRHLPLFFAGLTEGRVLPAIADRPFRDLADSLPGPQSAGAAADERAEAASGVRTAGMSVGGRVAAAPGGRAAGVPAAGGRAGAATGGQASGAAADERAGVASVSALRPAAPRQKVGFFSGCLIDFVYPQTGVAVQKVLTALGMEMVTPAAQSCCGYPAQQVGLPDVAAKLARQNIAAFEAAGVDKIVTACPTCAEALKSLYPQLLAGEKEWSARAQAMADKVQDFSSFVHEHRDELPLNPQEQTFTYHDSCHLKRRLGVTAQPRELLAAAGGTIVEMSPADICCGFGGSYSIKFPEISQAVLGRKLQAVTGTGASVVAVDCPGCRLQIAGGLAHRGSPVEVRHTAEILAERLKK